MTGIAASLDELLALRSEAALLLPLLENVSALGAGSTRIAPTRSRGMEYAESRVYSPGDDARRIDWRVTARRGQTHLKLFHEQRDRYVAVGVDLGATMAFATRGAFKSVVAIRAAALVMHALKLHHDHVSLWVATESSAVSSAPGTGRGAVRALCQLLVDQQPAPRRQPVQPTPAASFCTQTVSSCPDAGLIVLVSDFYNIDDAFVGALRAAATRCPVLMIWTVDPMEMVLPADMTVSDGRQRMETAQLAAAHRFTFASQRLAQLEAAASVPGVACISIATDDPSMPDALRAAVRPAVRVQRCVAAARKARLSMASVRAFST